MMRLDQIIQRIDKLSKIEKLAIAGRIMYQLDLKGEWLTEEERLAKKMKRKREKKRSR